MLQIRAGACRVLFNEQSLLYVWTGLSENAMSPSPYEHPRLVVHCIGCSKCSMPREDMVPISYDNSSP